MDVDLMKRCRDAEEAAEYWERRALSAESSRKLAVIRMRQAEDVARGWVSMWKNCRDAEEVIETWKNRALMAETRGTGVCLLVILSTLAVLVMAAILAVVFK